MQPLALAFALAALAARCAAVVLPTAQPQCLAFAPSAQAVPLLARRQRAGLPPIVTAPTDWPGVQRAAQDLSADFERTTGTPLPVVNYTGSWKGKTPTAIIVGTLGKSELVDALVTAGKIDVSGIRGKWEAFMLKHVAAPIAGVSDALVIVGADKRGSIFGVYTVSEQLGVSPWYYWTDTPPVQRNNGVYIVKGSDCSAGSPTVQYRGIFINDEQPSITNWAEEKLRPKGSNLPSFRSNFYVLIFEALLRLKANYFWPPVWNSAFALDDPANQGLADYFGIVMGTSHQEPMMRSSPVEWNRLGYGTWSFESNPENVTRYFIEGAQRGAPFENVVTVGMRGSGDLPLGPTTNIDLLERVIKKQREILSDVFNTTDLSTVPQVWCLYKEVQNYYNMGMRVPDDITLLWTDDNWGHIQRLPSDSERNRWGGAGIYFHVDYVGDPMDYKWINTINNAQSYQQLNLAVEYNATRVWILNVGDFKANEIPTEFFLSMAYNASAFDRNNLLDYYANWARREFQVSPTLAKEISGIVSTFSRLTAIRKPELTTPATFSTTNYREADTYNAQWQQLLAAAETANRQIPRAAQDAFFQTVLHPVAATANLHALYIAAKKNEDLASQASSSANTYAQQVEDAFDVDWDLREKYHTIRDGKWNHMMDQTHLGYYYWQQPMQDTLPPLRKVRTRAPALAGVMRITAEGSIGAWPGDNRNNCKDGYNCGWPTLATLSPYGPKSRYIDVSPSGPNGFSYTATSLAPWLVIANSQGRVGPADVPHRVELSVDWSKFPSGGGVQNGLVTFKSSVGDAVNVNVPAVKTAPAAGFEGFVEADGIVSMEAEHWSRNAAVDGVSLAAFPAFGSRAFAGVSNIPGLAPTFIAGAGPSVEYDFYTFNTPTGGNSTTYTVNAYLFSSFNLLADGPLLYGISLDGGPVQTVQPVPDLPKEKYVPPDWNDAVANGVRIVKTAFKDVAPGKHTLKISMITPGVVFEKFVVDVGGLLPSYLGPPESSRVR
ncbi:hypothetical protein AURDEDRAFT_87784 [Auricularia subglabra TFB-10046 SS5]|nr:hypothetical protein AURDEDRAFT_87784 [Auricularia subglabra TFB-10046 SS5]